MLWAPLKSDYKILVCNYYYFDYYNSLIANQADKNSMQLVNFNIQSFHSMGEAFTSLIELLPILPDIIAELNRGIKFQMSTCVTWITMIIMSPQLED